MKKFKQFYEEVGAAGVTSSNSGSTSSSPIANVTGSSVQTDIPFPIQNKKKKTTIIKRKAPT